MQIDEERIMAEVSYFQSTLKDTATLWFNNLDITVAPGRPVGTIGTLAELLAAFQLHFLFDPAQKWRHLADFFKTRQTVGEKSEDYIRRVQEDGLKARATEEQILNTIMGGFLPFIQVSVSNHDIEGGAAGLASIKKWSAVAETFVPTGQVNADNARLQRQIEEIEAKLERTQMRFVDTSTSRKADLFDDTDEVEASSSTRTATPEQDRGRPKVGSNRSRSPAPANMRGGEGQRSRSSGPAIQQQRDTSRSFETRKFENQGASGGRQYGQQGGGQYDGQTRSDNRGGPPRRGMQPSFFGEVGALPGEVVTGLMGKQQILGKIRGKILDKWLGKTLGNLGGVISNNPTRCERGACPALPVTCFNCGKVGHFSNKCWSSQNQ